MRPLENLVRKHLVKVAVIPALTLAGTLFLAPTALAQESETTRQLEADAARYRELLEAQRAEQARLEASLGELSAALTARLEERDRVGQELLELRAAREALEGSIAELEADLGDKRAQVERLNAEQDALKVRVQALLVELYKGRADRFAGALLRTETFHDLRVRNHYLSKLSDQDAALLNDLSATVAALEAAQSELAAKLADLSDQEAALRQAEDELGAKRAELESVVGALERDREGQQALRLESLRAQESLDNSVTAALQRRDEEVARLVREEEARKARAAREAERLQREAERRAAEAAEAARVAAEAEAAEAAKAAAEAEEAARAAAEAEEAATRAVAERNARTSTLDASEAPEGEAVSPFPNPRVLSRYGEQGGTSVTLQAEQEGAAVHAVLPGEVIISQFFSANTGYMVTIEHGPDLFTVYKNLQAPLVEAGDQVTRGQVVGYLGGGITQPDTLEFLVGVPRANGSFDWIDPATLLSFR